MPADGKGWSLYVDGRLFSAWRWLRNVTKVSSGVLRFKGRGLLDNFRVRIAKTPMELEKIVKELRAAEGTERHGKQK